MKNIRFLVRLYIFGAVATLAVIAILVPRASIAGDKLKPEEIVARHLESIGTAEARAGIHSRIVGGKVVVAFSSPGTQQFTGQAVMASEGNKNLISMNFESANYAQENIGFDGENVSVGYARAGVRTNLGDLLWTYKPIVKSGLVGGTLSQSWPLLNEAGKNYKLEGGGTRKIEGRPAYEVRFIPRGGSDMEIRLYFDAETFQHVRTEYMHTIIAQLGGNVDSSAHQRTTRYRMTEDFSGFQKEGALTLPHSYKISMELDATSPFRAKWDLALEQFAFNEAIPPEMFKMTAKP